MPTVGWIWDKDNDAFFEATSIVPAPGGEPTPSFRCPFCVASFKEPAPLRLHLEEAHVGHRPFMTINGIEPKSADTVRKRIEPDSVEFFDTTGISLSGDGIRFEGFSSGDLKSALGRAERGRFWFRLENEFDAKAQSIRTDYDLNFKVYDDGSALGEVDRLFVALLGKGGVHLDDVDNFIRQSTRHAVDEYCDALAGYVIGVLVKDADPSTGIHTANRDYRARLHGSLRTLQEFERPLARLICALIRFSSNDFEASHLSLTGYELLDFANAQIAPLAKGGSNWAPKIAKGSEVRGKISVCPVDNGSDMVMRLADQLASLSRWGPALQQQLEAESDVPDIDPLDREKIWVVWAQAAARLGKKECALLPLRMLAGSYCFGHWADTLLREYES